MPPVVLCKRSSHTNAASSTLRLDPKDRQKESNPRTTEANLSLRWTYPNSFPTANKLTCATSSSAFILILILHIRPPRDLNSSRLIEPLRLPRPPHVLHLRDRIPRLALTLAAAAAKLTPHFPAQRTDLPDGAGGRFAGEAVHRVRWPCAAPLCAELGKVGRRASGIDGCAELGGFSVMVVI